MTTTIFQGDVLEQLDLLPSDHFDCVVTSPPYWGLRDYGTAAWAGGDPACDHLGEPFRTSMGVNVNTGTGQDVKNLTKRQPFKLVCGKCGARRQDFQLGLEPTLGEHIEAMVRVFREVRRVLKPQGTLWLNYGDTYATSVNGRSAADTKATGNDDRTFRDKPFSTVGPVYDPKGGSKGGGYRGANKGNALPPSGRVCSGGVLKPKDLCGVPWRLALALQEDGWWLRQDIIWHKPNPMPESISDRCTKAHEYMFLLAKSERYYFDAEAIKEPGVTPAGTKGAKGSAERAAVPGVNARPPEYKVYDGMRNRRSVWTVATKPFKEAHFATFPPALIEPCIRASTSERGNCPICGKGWVRIVKKRTEFCGGSGAAGRTAEEVNASGKWAGQQYGTNLKLGPVNSTETAGWRPTCKCELATPVPARVLDPFGGSGTTAVVSEQLGRDCALIELNGDYVEMARRRIDTALAARV